MASPYIKRLRPAVSSEFSSMGAPRRSGGQGIFLICCTLLNVLLRKGKGPEGRKNLAQGARRSGVSTFLPSPLGRGWPAAGVFISRSGPGEGLPPRRRPSLRSRSQRCYTLPVRIPTQRVRELRRTQTDSEKAVWYQSRDRRLGAKFRRQCRSEQAP
jgi:hypothetical protein